MSGAGAAQSRVSCALLGASAGMWFALSILELISSALHPMGGGIGVQGILATLCMGAAGFFWRLAPPPEVPRAALQTEREQAR